jgi:hypothetical protein
MIDFITYLIVGCLWCFGFWKLWDDLLLPLRVKIEEYLPMKATKPLFNCVACMASVHGFFLGLYFFGFAPVIILYCFALCGLNYLVLQWVPEYD